MQSVLRSKRPSSMGPIRASTLHFSVTAVVVSLLRPASCAERYSPAISKEEDCWRLANMTLQSIGRGISKLTEEVRRSGNHFPLKGLSSDPSERVKSKVRDPLHWLQHHTETKDPHWREVGAASPYRSFPYKHYF